MSEKSVKPVGFDSKSVEYKNFHKRMRKIRGDAFEFDCVDCGLEAKEWSHRHGTDPRNMRNYDPRCVKCHHIYDGCMTENQRGENHCRARFSNNDIKNIRSLREQGWTYQRIGEKFGVGHSTIGKILRGERWSHV